MINNRYEQRLIHRVSSISKQAWLAAGAALIVGVIAHIAALTGLLVNGDGMVPVVSGRWLLMQGKWANGFFADMRGIVNMTIVTGFLALIWLSLSAGMMVSVLNIKSKALCVLCGAMMVTFPAVVCTYFYNAPDIFFFSLMLSVSAVYVTKRYRYGFVPGALLLGLSAGVYQAYVGMAAGLFLLLALSDLLEGEKPLKEVLLTGAKYIGVLLAGVILYYGTLQLILHTRGMSLANYRGIDQMGQFTLASLWQAVVDAYEKVLRFFLFDQYGATGAASARTLYQIVLAVCASLFIGQVWRAKLYRKPGRLAVALALVAVMPIAIHAVAVLGQNAETHWLMIYAFVLVFVTMLKLADLFANAGQPVSDDSIQKRREGLSFGAKACSILVSAALICSWYLVTTQNYARMRLAYEGAFGTATVIASGILAQEDFDKDTPVAVIGGITEQREDFKYLNNFTGGFDKDMLFNSWVAQSMITRYVQVDMVFVSVEEKERLLTNPAFLEMPVYPNNGYIQSIDGVIVVKLAQDEPIIFG